MRLASVLLIFGLSFQAFGLGTVPISNDLRSRYETQVKGYFGLKNAQLEVERIGSDGGKSFHFRLGQLSLAEFESLKIQLAFPLNPKANQQIVYNPNKHYSLTDFLLPKMQAPLGKMIAATEELPWLEKLTGSSEMLVETNCWSTAYDIYQSVHDPLTSFLYIHSNDDEMTRLLKDARFSKAIQLKDLKPYDYVIYYSQSEDGKFVLDHVAVSIGGGIAYQKTGNSEVDYYNMEPLEEISLQRKNLNPDKKLVVEYRRLVAAFPHPYKIWGAKAKDLLTAEQTKEIPSELIEQVTAFKGFEDRLTYSRIRPIQILKNNKGDFVFNPRDSLSKQFRALGVTGGLQKGIAGYSDSSLKTKICEVEDETYAQAIQFQRPDQFQVEIASEEVSCLTPDGQRLNKFWIPQEALQ